MNPLSGACACTSGRLPSQRYQSISVPSVRRSVPLAAIASLGAIYAVWTLGGAGEEALKWGAVLLAVGGVVYALMRLLRSSPAAAANRAGSPE